MPSFWKRLAGKFLGKKPKQESVVQLDSHLRPLHGSKANRVETLPPAKPGYQKPPEHILIMERERLLTEAAQNPSERPTAEQAIHAFYDLDFFRIFAQMKKLPQHYVKTQMIIALKNARKKTNAPERLAEINAAIEHFTNLKIEAEKKPDNNA